ncbi:MAG: hypothetical protein EXR98_12190 [Gemmataceae bacterium]|nr:hypothetical protein [Gemmataceae bacterium]
MKIYASLLAIACFTIPGFSVGVDGVNADPANDGPPRIEIQIKPFKAAVDDDEMQKLLKARFNELLALTQATNAGRQAARLTPKQMIDPARELMRAGLAIYDRSEEKCFSLCRF